MKDQSQTTETQSAAPENKLEVEEAGKKRLNELGEKPIGRLLLQYALPAITAMAASSLYNIIDGIFIGQGVGPEAIMGLALTGPLMALGAAFGALVADVCAFRPIRLSHGARYFRQCPLYERRDGLRLRRFAPSISHAHPALLRRERRHARTGARLYDRNPLR